MKTQRQLIAGLAAVLALVAMSCHGAIQGGKSAATARCGAPCEVRPAVFFNADEDLFAWAFTEPHLDGENLEEPDAPNEAPQPAAAERLEVRELFAARSVVNRNPRGIGLHFAADSQKVWAYTKVQNRNAPSHVTMEWRRNGVPQKSVEVPVGRSDAWRTWSSHKMASGDEGSWTVEVRGPNGRVLDRTEFEVDPSPQQRSTSVEVGELAASSPLR